MWLSHPNTHSYLGISWEKSAYFVRQWWQLAFSVADITAAWLAWKKDYI